MIFVHKNVDARQLNISAYCLEFYIEICAIAFDELKLKVVSYHSTSGNSFFYKILTSYSLFYATGQATHTLW